MEGGVRDDWPESCRNGDIAQSIRSDARITESIDDYLQKEFEERFRAILKDELSPRTKQNQKRVKKNIAEFVKAQSHNNEYVELPYFMLIEARKA